MLGLWGMGGIGKTTLATALFNELLPEFGDDACFLDDVCSQANKSQGLLAVQQELLQALTKAATIVRSEKEGTPVHMQPQKACCRASFIG